MSRLLQFIERMPLGYSLLALILSLPALRLAALPTYVGPPEVFEFGFLTVSVWIVSFVIWMLACVGVIRAATHGYSSLRVSLAAVALFFGFVPSLLLATKLWRSLSTA
jgi:hypothetical protein